MPKNIEDVIIPERRRTIRDIPIPESRRRTEVPPVPPPLAPREYSYPEANKPSRGSKKKLWVTMGFVVLVLIFALLSYFNGATLAYIPKSAPLSFANDVYSAQKTDGDLSYSVVKLSKEKSKDVPASGTEEVSRKASGTIVVYNNTSAEPQSLLIDTRFETPDGKIYKVPKAIVVPGKKVVDGKDQPGSLEILVYADKEGDSYNIGLSDFTLPGFKGGPKYTTIYARSKTPMTGGFVGQESVVDGPTKVQAEREIYTSLEEELISEAKAQVPEGFIMLPSLTSMKFESLPQAAASGANATIKVRGDFAGVMFKASDFSTHLAQKKIALSARESVDIVPIESLQITFVGSVPVDLVSLDEIDFSVTGEGSAVWRTDEVALKTDLTGKHKRDISSILNNYPTIVSATATIKPFWKNTFPVDQGDITIKKLLVN